MRIAAALLVAAAVACAQDGPAARMVAFRKHADAKAEAGIPALREGLRDADADVRRAAIAALGRYARADLLPLLAEQASDADPRFAGDALRALGVSGWEAMPHLIAGLTHCVNAVSEVALGEARRACGVHADRTVLADAWNSSRGDRIRFLASVLISDADGRARGDALRALGDRREAASVAVLSEATCEGAHEETRRAALVRATGLSPRGAEQWRAWWSANRGRSRVEWLQAALVGSEDSAERASAARALAEEKDPHAAEYVVLYGFRDGDCRVREAAFGALRARADLPFSPESPSERDIEAWLIAVRPPKK